jgi:hypothetical protein
MALQLSASSNAVLASMQDGLLIGVYQLHNQQVQLFIADNITNSAAHRFAGHRDLIRSGILRLDEALGFSLQVTGGEIRSFYRTSILNRDFDDFCIPDAIMLEVIAALRLPTASGFRSYP